MSAVAFSGFDHVQLTVPEGVEAACRDFYVGLLGLAEIERPEAARRRSVLWVDLGGQGRHFRSRPEFRPSPFAHPAILVRGLEALAARLRTAGYDVTTEQSIGPGRFHVRDPFGNRLEFIEAESPDREGKTSP